MLSESDKQMLRDATRRAYKRAYANKNPILDWKDIPGDTKDKYMLYLASRDWGVLREMVMGRCDGICERCKWKPATQVHHLTYIRKYREQIEDLQAICRQCHEFTHGKSNFDPIAFRNKMEGTFGEHGTGS